MVIDMGQAAEVISCIVVASGGIYSVGHHFISKAKKKKEKYRQDILDQAKEEMSKIEAELNEKIKDLALELSIHKENIVKDMDHYKEIYNAEIKVLGSKIDDLRQDLSEQHANMVNLLTKLVNR